MQLAIGFLLGIVATLTVGVIVGKRHEAEFEYARERDAVHIRAEDRQAAALERIAAAEEARAEREERGDQ